MYITRVRPLSLLHCGTRAHESFFDVNSFAALGDTDSTKRMKSISHLQSTAGSWNTLIRQQITPEKKKEKTSPKKNGDLGALL